MLCPGNPPGSACARASNELFRRNLAAGQTGLSIAFDLPTQCGYSSNEEIALPEVGRVGVGAFVEDAAGA